ncbi:MAG: hypothetical protein FYV88_3390 [Bacteroidetes bacterium]|nr:hypothetical protein [Bacteroidota bacterium]
MIWLFESLERLFNNEYKKKLLFNKGIVLGIEIICYKNLFILVVLVLFEIEIVRKFNLKEWMVLIMGVMIKYYFVIEGGYMLEKIILFLELLKNI